MKMKRIISTVLAVLMLMSAFSVMAYANGATGEVTTNEWKTKSSQPTLHYFTGTKLKISEDKGTNYLPDVEGGVVINTPEDKLEYMDLRFERDGYQLYVDHYSGEVATRCIATGEILFSNPYTVGNSSAVDSIKTQLMSQLVVKYTDIVTGDENTYYSYQWAAQRNQIVVRNIKNGIRVEYTIGREESRMLVPRLISKESFENNILNVINAEVANAKEIADKTGTQEAKTEATNLDFISKQLLFYYQEYDPSQETSEQILEDMYKNFPITKKMAVYALDTSVSDAQLAKLEQYIKTYCPDYTYEMLDEDHLLTEYEGEDKNPPLFKMALEYTLDNMGVTVSLPANGIRFNEALYQLEYIEILPYMGAGAKSNAESNFSQYNSGYTFFPDGSGAIFDFEKITNLGSSLTVSGKVYGQDYAYHTLSTTPHQEVIRYPVFGIAGTQDMTALENATVTSSGKGSNVKYSVSSACDVAKADRDYKTSGFMAIIEEGDAMVELSSYHAVRPSEYNTVRMKVYPRPKDEYNVADSISVGANDTWTVVSSRKYTGDYSIRYIMLTDDEVAKSKGITDYYDCSYVGMARAYREYLENKEVLTRLSSEDVGNDIPLYIEAFGTIETTQKILSMPVEVMTPLTTFEDIQTMRDSLAEKGIENINFILNGFTKGGLTDRQSPYYVSWDGSVDDELSFEELLKYAEDNGFGVYPDFNFAYVSGDDMFDGVSLSKHAVKTIDNRYTSKREYSATKQTYVSYYELAISPAYYVHYYEKFTEEYKEYDPMGVSISTLGSALNSDFDEDEPYNREDSKGYTIEAFKHFAENYEKVMTAGGNAYAWGYVDYITDIALDSSRFSQAYASVPFLGMVLHGYVEIAGTPINMEGNIDYAVLKAIENGASLKFILSYRNTNNLKQFEDLSKYYSVRYDIWYEDVVSLYNEVNNALAGVQTSLIEKHEFVDGIRIPDADELLADAANTVEKALKNEEAYLNAADQAEKDMYRIAREEIKNFDATYKSYIAAKATYDVAVTTVNNLIASVEADIKTIVDSEAIINDDKAPIDDRRAAITAKNDAIVNLQINLTLALTGYGNLCGTADEYDDTTKGMSKLYSLIQNEYKDMVEGDVGLTAQQKHDVLSNLPEVAYCNAIDALAISADKKASYKNLDDIDAVIAAINADADIADADKTALVNKLTYVKTVRADMADAADFVNKQVAINATLDEIRNKITGFIQSVQSESADDMKPIAAGTFVLPEEKICTFNAEANDGIIGGRVEAPIYTSDVSKIVYEVYDNGTAFLLNFNNYQVMVEIDEVIYTLDAYGYVILSNND